MRANINPELAVGLRCIDRDTGLDTQASPTEIYFNLAMDRVHFVPQVNTLYFAQSRHFPIHEIIDAVHQGFNVEPEVEQLYLDEHGYYKGAQRVAMTASLANALLVALRLKGIKISIASDG